MADTKESPIRHLVRVVNTDLHGNKHLVTAMQKIKGVSIMYANAICKVTKIDPQTITGKLTEQQVEKLNDAIQHPLKYNIPVWMLNRRKDPESGNDRQILTSDVRFIRDEDIKRMKKIKSYKGMRHQWGVPVRGQKTKSNFRRNKGKLSLGVKRRAGAKTGK